MTMPITRHKFKKYLDSEEFYNLCQTYRTMPITEQERVVRAFEDIKRKILEQLRGPR